MPQAKAVSMNDRRRELQLSQFSLETFSCFLSSSYVEVVGSPQTAGASPAQPEISCVLASLLVDSRRQEPRVATSIHHLENVARGRLPQHTDQRPTATSPCSVRAIEPIKGRRCTPLFTGLSTCWLCLNRDGVFLNSTLTPLWHRDLGQDLSLRIVRSLARHSSLGV